MDVTIHYNPPCHILPLYNHFKSAYLHILRRISDRHIIYQLTLKSPIYALRIEFSDALNLYSTLNHTLYNWNLNLCAYINPHIITYKLLIWPDIRDLWPFTISRRLTNFGCPSLTFSSLFYSTYPNFPLRLINLHKLN